MVIEAKEPDEKVEKGFKEAQLYAHELNKRWRTGFNPVEMVGASNGHLLMYGNWESDDAIILEFKDLVPGTAVFEEFRAKCRRSSLLEHARKLRSKLHPRARYKAMEKLGGAFKRDRPLEANQFAKELVPIFRAYFDSNLDRTNPTILEHAYVSTRENTHYDAILESLLRDNLARHKHPDFEVIETTKKDASGLDLAIKSAIASTTSPMIMLIGGVGSGKSIFIDKYFKSFMDDTVRRRTVWIFIDFNIAPGDLANLDSWIVQAAIEDLPLRNKINDFKDYDNLIRYFGLDIKDLRNGPYKKLAESQPDKFDEIVSHQLARWVDDKEKFLKSVINHYGLERGVSVVVVFDNADRRDAEQQLKIFQSVQHFRSANKAFCILSLRDETYHRFKNEPPLDAFYKPFLFMIQSARFLDIARKRLDLVIKDLAVRAPKKTTYTLSNGAVVEYPASELGNYLHKIYNSLFNPQKSTRYLFEALAGRNIRTALEMFAEVVMSPHFDTDKIFATRFKTEPDELQEWMIVRILMRRNFAYYQTRKGNFIWNLFDIDEGSGTTTIFLLSILLHRLSKDRKSKGELNIEGYRQVSKIIEDVSDQGFLAEDILWGLEQLLERSLIIADHQRLSGLIRGDYVKITASGHYHLTQLLDQPEYVNGVSMDVWLRDELTTQRLLNLGDLNEDPYDVDFPRIHIKLNEFHKAVVDESKLHFEQSTIDLSENNSMRLVLRKIDRAINW